MAVYLGEIIVILFKITLILMILIKHLQQEVQRKLQIFPYL